jgi:hypothetical protein
MFTVTELRLKPGYAHAVAEKVKPPKTRLTAETAFPIYEKLKEFLRIEINSQCPAWWQDGKHKRDLFYRSGHHHRVRWAPKDEKGWRKLNFDEFCIWYGIKI